MDYFEYVKTLTCKKRKLLQAKISKQTNTKFNTIRNWRYRGLYPKTESQKIIADLLKTDVNILFPKTLE